MLRVARARIVPLVFLPKNQKSGSQQKTVLFVLTRGGEGTSVGGTTKRGDCRRGAERWQAEQDDRQALNNNRPPQREIAA